MFHFCSDLLFFFFYSQIELKNSGRSRSSPHHVPSLETLDPGKPDSHPISAREHKQKRKSERSKNRKSTSTITLQSKEENQREHNHSPQSERRKKVVSSDAGSTLSTTTATTTSALSSPRTFHKSASPLKDVESRVSEPLPITHNSLEKDTRSTFHSSESTPSLPSKIGTRGKTRPMLEKREAVTFKKAFF